MKVLIGYDDSPQSQDALQDLVRAGLPRRTKVCILVARNPWIDPEFLSTREPGVKAWYSAAHAQALSDAEETLVKARKIGGKAVDFLKGFFPEWTFAVDPHVGPADRALLEKAEEWSPTLIVLGTRDLSRLGDLFLGSISQKVLHHAPCSVRIGRPHHGKLSEPTRILLAMDGSTDADAALREVLKRSWPEGTEVKLVAAMDFRMRVNEQFGEAAGSGKRAIRKASEGTWPWMEKILEKAADRLSKEGLRTATAVMEGEARETILREAAAWKAHCIFIGSRGLSGLRRVLMGSVSSAVAAHGPCTVEVIRPHDHG